MEQFLLEVQLFAWRAAESLGSDFVDFVSQQNIGGTGKGRFDPCTPKVRKVVLSGWEQVAVGNGECRGSSGGTGGRPRRWALNHERWQDSGSG